MSATMKLTKKDLKAIRLAREEKGITRDEIASALEVSYKAVEKFENGRLNLSQDKQEKLFKALGLDEKELKRIKKHWVVVSKRVKTVFENSQRRSYRRHITKEVKVLIHLRKLRKLTQDKASQVCKYSRATIGHIENGRIEIPPERIRHIVQSYGFGFSRFEEFMKEEVLREEVLKDCHDRLATLPEEKLKLFHTMLKNL